jgi:hypothetical protein
MAAAVVAYSNGINTASFFNFIYYLTQRAQPKMPQLII